MDLFLIGANIAIMLVILVVLNRMAKKHVSFSKRVFVGLGIGIVFGAADDLWGESSCGGRIHQLVWHRGKWLRGALKNDRHAVSDGLHRQCHQQS